MTYEPRSPAPLHVHAEEQHIIVISSVLPATVDGETRTMAGVDYCVIPSWVPRTAETHNEPCAEIDIFKPLLASMVAHGRALDASRLAGTPRANAPSA